MYSYSRRGPGMGTALLAVLQAILLLSALVLAPAAVIAQDADPAASPDPATETTGEPAVDPTPEPKAQAAPKNSVKRERPKGTAPKATPKPAAEKSLGEQGWTIRFWPKKVKVALGGKVVVAAYKCRANDKTPFGGAKGSGNPKDYCDLIRVKWTVDGDGAKTSNTFGKKTKLTLLDDSEPIRLIATVDDLKRPTKIIVKQKAAKKRPEALNKQQIQEAQASKQSPSNSTSEPKAGEPTDEPTAEEPTAEPTAEEPTAEPTDEPDCLADPVSGECLVELPDRPGDRVPEEPTEAPSEEPTEAPSEEPSEAPSEAPSEEPTDQGTDVPAAERTEERPTECLADPVTGECLVELPERSTERELPVEEAPTEEPEEPEVAEPTKQFSVAANASFRIRKGGDRINNGSLTDLQGAYFDVYRDDDDNNSFDPGSGDTYVGTFGPTNVNGWVDATVSVDEDNDFWVIEDADQTSIAGWDVITEMAPGNGDSPGINEPYAYKYNNINQNNVVTRQFVNRRDNPDFPDACGLKVALVFDRSNSINDNEWNDMRDAGHAFVDALVGTPSELAVYWFSTDAAQTLGWTNVFGGGGAVKTAIDSLAGFGGATNWDAAFRQVAGDGADIIVVLTDGNPTTHHIPDVGDGGDTDMEDVEAGVASANLAKASGPSANLPKIVAVGIGTGVSPLNLRLISGDTLNDDYFVTNWSTLDDTLEEIADKLCGGTVTVHKLVNDGGGFVDGSNWTFQAKKNGNSLGSQQTNADGLTNFDFDNNGNVTAQIIETVKNGYAITQVGGKNAVCTDQDGSITVNNITDGVQFQLGATDSVTCTFKNEPSTGTITVIKNIINDNGGQVTDPDAFDLTIGGQPASSGVAQVLSVGTYAIGEGSVDGYSFVDITGHQNCPAALGGNVNLGAGQNITCTITNDDDPAGLFLHKSVVNDNGGDELPGAWTLSAGDNDVTGSVAGALATSVAGTYALDEDGPAGYSLSSLTCDNSQGQVTSVTVGLGETVHCYFENDDDPAGLFLHKSVVNDNGGDELPGAWTLSAGDNDVTGSVAGALATSVAGTYALDEDGPAGYSLSSLTCDNSQGQVTSVTVGLGETVHCYFENDDDPAGLFLHKSVVNDNGGDELPGAWTLSAGDNDVTGSVAGALATSVAGTYALDEDGPAGYSLSSLTCDNSQGQVTSVTVGLGETVHCYFENDDDPAGLFLHKSVVNDNGGDELPGAWTLSAGDNDVTGSVAGALATSVAGTYALDEDGPAGYSLSSLTCDNSQGQVTSVTVGLGETVHCYFENDDDPAGLFLHKSVVNDNGGDELPGAWTLSAGDNDVTGSVAGALATSVAGTYALDEDGPAGYSLSSLTCDNSQGQVTSVTVGLGETVHCYFENDDDPSSLTLVKTVVGGPATESDFQASIDTVGAVDWDAAIPVDAGDHVASESWTIDDYVAGDWGGDCDAAGNVTIALGEDLECTISNFYAELTVVKEGTPSFYAEVGDVIDYTITATNTGLATLNGVDVTDEFPAGLDDFACTLNGAGDPIALPYDGLIPGDAIECTASHTIVEADIEAGSVFNQACADADEISDEVCDDTTVLLSELEIVKTADVDFYNAVGDEIAYTVIATNTGEAELTDVDITDSLIADIPDWTCDPTTPVASLGAGATIECTGTYTVDQADIDTGSVTNAACADSTQTAEVCDEVETPLAQLEIVKSASPDTYSAVGDEIVYTVTATNTGEATLENVDVSDALIDGLDSWTCQVGDAVATLPVAELLSGQSITCTATYAIISDDITGSKPQGSVLNTACAASDQTPEVCDEARADEIVIQLFKTVTPSVLAEPGGDFTYTLEVDNDSLVPLTITDLIDDNSGLSPDWAANCATLVGTVLEPDQQGPTDEATCTYTVERTVAGVYPNVAEVTGTDGNGRVITAQDDATVTVLSSEITIEKTADVDFFTAAGDEIVYTVTATNVGEATLTNVDITDELVDGLDSWSCDPGNPVATLAPGATITCEATYTVTEADVDAGEVLNTACVDSDQVGPECGDVEVLLAELEIVKTANVDFYAAVGDEIEYTVTATNTGEAELTNVDISDSLIADIPDWTCDPTTPVASLVAGATIECTGTYTVDQGDIDAGSVTNAACVASDEVEETCDEVETPLAALEIVKEASHATFGAVGDEIVYTITATNVGQADLENVDISDELIAGLASWSCDPAIPADLLEPGDSIVCEATYVITQDDVDAQEVLNTACAESDQTTEVCDEVVVDYIDITLVKTASVPSVATTGDDVTFTLEFQHSLAEPPIYLYDLDDDIFGNLLAVGNTDVTDNSCVGLAGTQLLPNVAYTCEFTGSVAVTLTDPHVNVATITVTDANPNQPGFATASDDATVTLTEVQSTPFPSPSPTLTPTDMLPSTDTFGSGNDSDSMGGILNWAIWLMLSALLIIGTGWIIRREKLEAVKNR